MTRCPLCWLVCQYIYIRCIGQLLIKTLNGKSITNKHNSELLADWELKYLRNMMYNTNIHVLMRSLYRQRSVYLAVTMYRKTQLHCSSTLAKSFTEWSVVFTSAALAWCHGKSNLYTRKPINYSLCVYCSVRQLFQLVSCSLTMLCVRSFQRKSYAFFYFFRASNHIRFLIGTTIWHRYLKIKLRTNSYICLRMNYIKA